MTKGWHLPHRHSIKASGMHCSPRGIAWASPAPQTWHQPIYGEPAEPIIEEQQTPATEGEPDR